MAKKQIIKDHKTGQVFRSKDELFISWYLEELKELGYVKRWVYEFKTFTLGEEDHRGVVRKYEQLQTKIKETNNFKRLLQAHRYTPDFGVEFNEIANNIFYCNHDSIISEGIPFTLYKIMKGILEVKFEKGKFQGSKPKTNISRKWMLDKHDLFVEEITFKDLFDSSFTPRRYTSLDGGTVKFKRHTSKKHLVRNIETYIELRKKLNVEYFNLKQKFINQ